MEQETEQTMDAETLERDLRIWLDEKLGVRDVGRDDELVSVGLIDSGSLVLLAEWLERVTEIEIPDDDIDADHFDSIAMIVSYIGDRSVPGD
jgi:acyl carrier protein